MFPSLLPTVPRSGQRGVKVNWHHNAAMLRKMITTRLCGMVIDL